MSSRNGSASNKLGGWVRTLVLLIAGVALFVLVVGTYVDQNGSQEVCAKSDAGGGGGGGGAEQAASLQGALRSEFHQARGNQSSTGGEEPPLAPWDYNWDKKAAEVPVNAGRVPDRTLILVRHGKYDFDTGKLTPLGREQADLTGRRLKEMNLTFRSITHSTLERASETAQLIHSHMPDVPLGLDDLLREGGPIPPNPTVSYWSLPEKDYIVDGPRLESAFRKYFYRPSGYQRGHVYEILVGHGNIFRFFALRALQLPKDAWMRVFIAHASITLLDLRADGTVAMSKFGDAGHIPVQKVTF